MATLHAELAVSPAGCRLNVRLTIEADRLARREFGVESARRRGFEAALSGGGMALKAAAGLAQGNYADIVSLDVGDVPYLAADRILDHWMFSDGIAVDCVGALDRKQVEGGPHVRRDVIGRRFRTVMQE
ncbi:hypothetical protein [Neorhizobium sp. LjRoot104]|uniref:hypothetical protein n=1 Tax=Neorhizobium sp. LjRoot104 TaxID=3342254 RepID=UPI003F4FEF94